MKLKDARTLRPQELLERRKQALLLFTEHGMTRIEIAQLVGVHRNTVGQWIAKWKEGGPRNLKVKASGRPIASGRRLSRQQEISIRRKITDKHPEQMKLDFALWTRKAVQQLIHQETGQWLPIRTVGEYLRRWNFTPQKPLRRAYERNARKVREWLDVTYPQIARQARREKAELQWGDETGIHSNDVHGKGYAPVGKTPVRLGKGTPEKINMISSVTNQGKVRFMFYRGTLNVAVFVEFLRRLIRDAKGRKIYLIVDNLRVHHSEKVKRWVEKHKQWIALFYLPSYSPDLNPDEFLNGDLKGEIGRRAESSGKGWLAKTALRSMRGIQKQPARVRKYFDAESIQYAR